jgi:hypothetical protein
MHPAAMLLRILSAELFRVRKLTGSDVDSGLKTQLMESADKEECLCLLRESC